MLALAKYIFFRVRLLFSQESYQFSLESACIADAIL